VTAYIADHLDGDLTFDRLSGVACFSPYHFHRIYRAIMGETVADTIRRCRLHRAANELARSERPVEQVARRAGYGSVEAFTRAFSADHGVGPVRFRARQLAPKANDGDETMYDVTFKVFEGVDLAAIVHRGAYTTIGTSFEQLTTWAGARNLLAEPRRWFAIYYDDSESVPARDLRSDACVEIAPGTVLDDGVVARRLEPGRMATVVHRGPYAELERAYRFLYRDWLPDAGEEAADRPCFEQYLNNPRQTAPAELLTEIFLPLKG
jgi:AraC family transcriptional regulator